MVPTLFNTWGTDYSNIMIVEGTELPLTYLSGELYKLKNVQVKADDIRGLEPSDLKGKKWTAFGDSITNSQASSKEYHEYIAEETGIVVTNMGVGGSGYKASSPNDFVTRSSNIPTDTEYLTILGSINDTMNGYTIGAATDTTADTVLGCVNLTIDNVLTRIPGVRLGLISPLPSATNYPSLNGNSLAVLSDGLKAICERRGIPFLDLYRRSNLQPQLAAYRDIYYKNDSSGNVEAAGIHPNALGHKIFKNAIKQFLKSL
jgi:lysophospholipase L1-like esterase